MFVLKSQRDKTVCNSAFSAVINRLFILVPSGRPDGTLRKLLFLHSSKLPSYKQIVSTRH